VIKKKLSEKEKE